MRYPVEWQEGYEDGYGDLSTGITYDDDPESDRSRAYDLGRNVGVLERVRKRIQDENVAYGDLYELQSLQAFIDPGDPELLEAAGVPEYTDENDPSEIECWLNLNGWGDAGYMERPAEQAAECERLRGYAECAVHAFDLATIDTDRNMRYVVHPFVSSEPYVNYCGLCALSSIDHTPGPDFVDPFDDVDEDGDAGCDVCGLESHPDHAQHEPDPDAMYDAARDEASEQARTDGRPDSWRDYMPGHPAWGRA